MRRAARFPRGMGAGLLFATGLKMAQAMHERWLYLPFAVLILVAMVVLKLPLPPLMLALLAVTAGLAWWRARRALAEAGKVPRP